MVAFALALVIVKGASMLLAVPLVASFLLMVTALTYQFQGWLAMLMSNPRRRRTVIMITTVAFVLIVQLPNLLNFYGPWRQAGQPNRSRRRSKSCRGYPRCAVGAISPMESPGDSRKSCRGDRACDGAWREGLERMERTARFANMVLPVGWLPLGVATAAEGAFLPSILGLLGMT